MSQLKRDEIKYIRDISKASYEKTNECRICGSTTDLEFHHYYTLTLLWNKWKKDNKILIESLDDIMYQREQFKGEHYKEIYSSTVTLCKKCHKDKLHRIYGKAPSLATAEKQRNWVEKQRVKYNEKNN